MFPVKNKRNSSRRTIVSCGSCNEEFITMKSFKNHFSISHSSEKLYFKCTLCFKTFQSQRLLQTHRKSCTTKDSFEKNAMDINNFIKVELVPDDEQMQQDEESSSSISNEDSDMPTRYAQFPKVYVAESNIYDPESDTYDALSNIDDVSSTLATDHPDKEKIIPKIPPIKICRISKNSKKLFTKTSTLMEKKTSSRVKRSIVSCGICNQEFLAIKAFKSHFSVNHTSETLFFKCPLCTKTFQLQRLLQNHRRSCITKDSFEKCATCEKVFASKNLLKKHITIHSDEKPHQCGDCHKNFRTKSDLKTHAAVHIPLEMRKSHTCDQCGRSFTLRRNFLTHLKMHNDPQIFICELCGHTFKTKGNLMSHQVHHTGEKRHACPLCEKCYASRAYLKIHILLHSNIKLHKCEVCGKDFARKSILTKHLYVHNGIRPYPCKFCSKAFRAKDKLVVHERIHTGEKPYKCEFCPVAFCESGNLQKHKRNVHKDMILQNKGPTATTVYDRNANPNINLPSQSKPYNENDAQFHESPIEVFQKLVKISENLGQNNLNHSNLADDSSKSEIIQCQSDIPINNEENCTSKLFMALQKTDWKASI